MLKKIAVVVVLAYAVHTWINIIEWSGVNQKIFNHAPGKCHHLQHIEYGSEDIQTLPNGLAFISSGIWLAGTEEYTKRPGKVFLFDFNRPNEPPQELTYEAPEKNFKINSAHGLNVWVDPGSGTVYVYLVSHHPAEIVDKFRFDEKKRSLVHVRRITGDPNFRHVNDLVLVAEDKFYFTNYYYYSFSEELYAGLRWGSVCYFDGTRSTLLHEGLNVPNGINLSRDKRLLYVAQCGDRSLLTYERLENNQIKLIHTLKVHTFIDNLDIDADTGDVWSGSHVAIHPLMKHIHDPAKVKAAAQVIKIKVGSDGLPTGRVEEVYSDDGDELCGTSIASRFGNGLLIGTVAHRGLYCQLNTPPSPAAPAAAATAASGKRQ